MKNALLPGLLAATVVSTVGCSIPYTTPETSMSVPYNTFVPGAVNGVTLPMLPPFADQQAPATPFPVPAEAKKFKLETVALILRMKNTGGLPLRLSLYLDRAGGNVYAKDPLGKTATDPGVVELPAGGETSKTFPLDPSLLQADQLQLGFKVGSPGTSSAVTIKDTDKIEVFYKVDVKAKII